MTDAEIRKIIAEINDSAEADRRAKAKRRHDIYRDGGQRFLVEQIKREFGEDALTEMRLAPLNLLKKIVNKRSMLYKKPPIRTAELPSDQDLIDFYTEELCVNTLFQKANRYYSLQSNTTVYLRPKGDEIKACVVPPYLYSVLSDPFDLSHIRGFVYNAFVEDALIAPQEAPSSSTNYESFSLERGFKTGVDSVASNEKDTDQNRLYLFWTAQEQFTTDDQGTRQIMNPNAGPEQFLNPIGMLPIINITKDRDNEAWASQGEDMVNLTMAIQMGWTDLLTIAKHQGFSIMTIIGEEEPKKLQIGINRGVFLRQREGGPTPSMQYVSGSSPLDEYKTLLMELMGLLLTTNDLSPSAISGSQKASQYNSGFQALIEMSDNLQAIEMDKPVFRDAEHEFWEVLSKWHNWMFDNGVLNEEARALGRFSDDLDVQVIFQEIKPLESEDEVINRIEKLRAEGLISRFDSMKKLHPELTDEQIQKKIDDIDSESKARMKSFANDRDLIPNNTDNQSSAFGQDENKPQSEDSGSHEESRINEHGESERVLVSNKTGKVIRVLG